MTHDPRKPGKDPDFERDFEDLQSAWNEMEAVEPPELLDRAVLNTARRDLEKPSRKRPLRWLGGFATATVMVLAVSLVLLQDPQAPAPAKGEIRLDQAAPAAPAAMDPELRIEKSALPAAEPLAPAREVKRESAARKASSLDLMQVAAPTKAMEAENQAEELGDTAIVEEMQSRPLPPEAWVEEMLSLLENGETGQLALSLEAFVDTYPDYPLPAELAERLP